MTPAPARLGRMRGRRAFGLDQKPIERLRATIALFHRARGMADPRERARMLEQLAADPETDHMRRLLVGFLRRADFHDALPNRKIEMIRTGAEWLREVDGMSSAALPELERMLSKRGPAPSNAEIAALI